MLGNGLNLSNVWTVFDFFSVDVVMKGSHGFISITEWPLMIVSRWLKESVFVSQRQQWSLWKLPHTCYVSMSLYWLYWRVLLCCFVQLQCCHSPEVQSLLGIKSVTFYKLSQINNTNSNFRLRPKSRFVMKKTQTLTNWNRMWVLPDWSGTNKQSVMLLELMKKNRFHMCLETNPSLLVCSSTWWCA